MSGRAYPCRQRGRVPTERWRKIDGCSAQSDQGKPSHLRAVAISGLIDDLYRGIVYPGGVNNVLFPPLWTLGVRPAYDVIGGQLQGVFRNLYANHPDRAQKCLENIATHRRTVLNDPIVQGINDTDNDWWRARSLVEKAPLIAHPIHMSGAFQDEQTGPRFPHLWEVIPNGVPKRLQMGNGDHGTQVANRFWQDRKAWLDCWIKIKPAPCTSFPDNATSTWVRTYLERRAAGGEPSGIIESERFPLESTTWTEWYLGADGAIVEGTPQAAGSGMYVSGTKRQSWSYYAYAPTKALPLALNTVQFGGLTGSRIMLPFVPAPSGLLDGPGCGNVDEVRCVHE